MNKSKFIIIVLIIISGIFRIWFLFHCDNFEGSLTMEKSAGALNILSNPTLAANFDGNTSVIYNYLLAGWLRIWPDVLIAPRVLSLIFGILCVIPFYFLVRLTFSAKTAFYASVLFTLFPAHAVQSTFSMSDAVFHFFSLSCLYFIFKFKIVERKTAWVVAAAVLLNACALLRFESWFYIPFLSILLLREGKKYSLMFFLLCLISPSFWMMLSYHFQRDALIAFTLPAMTCHREILMNRAPHPAGIPGWLNVLRMMLGPLILASALCGIIYSFIKKRSFYLGIFFIYLYFLYTASTIAEKTWYNERYAIILGILLLPYSVLFLEKFSVFLKARMAFLFLAFILISAINFNKIVHRYLIWHTLPPQIKEIACWLKKNASSGDKILLGPDKRDLYGQDIIVRSGIAPANFFPVTVFSPSPNLNKAVIENYIAGKRPKYLILNSEGYLNSLLNFDSDRNEIAQFRTVFKRVYFKDIINGGRFNIYRVDYQP